MTRRLDAWLEGRHVGRFVADDGPVRFVYDADAPEFPISLSLPRDGTAARKAAGRFLENLLPDNPRARIRLAAAYGAASADPFDLLGMAGGDIAGGLVLLPEGEPFPAGPVVLNPALDRDIADRINSLKLDPDGWAPRQAPARFSLAGTQGKFALAEVDGHWYWSNGSVPSTHIIKPGRADLPGVEEAEAAALALARAAGLRACSATVFQVADQRAFLVERFDRARSVGSRFATRLHAEDLAQARGIGPDHKYRITAREAIRTLGPVDPDGIVTRDFLAQLIFNTLLGNADAHAKNYSVLLRPSGVTLAPLYDTVPVGLYPQFDQGLAMRIAGARRAQAVTLDHWRKLAGSVGLDADELIELVLRIATRMRECNDSAWDPLGSERGRRARDTIARNLDRTLARR